MDGDSEIEKMILRMVMRWVLILGLVPNCYFTPRSSDNKGEPDQLSEDEDENTNNKVITKDNKG